MHVQCWRQPGCRLPLVTTGHFVQLSRRLSQPACRPKLMQTACISHSLPPRLAAPPARDCEFQPVAQACSSSSSRSRLGISCCHDSGRSRSCRAVGWQREACQCVCSSAALGALRSERLAQLQGGWVGMSWVSLGSSVQGTGIRPIDRLLEQQRPSNKRMPLRHNSQPCLCTRHAKPHRKMRCSLP